MKPEKRADQLVNGDLVIMTAPDLGTELAEVSSVMQFTSEHGYTHLALRNVRTNLMVEIRVASRMKFPIVNRN